MALKEVKLLKLDFFGSGLFFLERQASSALVCSVLLFATSPLPMKNLDAGFPRQSGLGGQ